MQPPAIPSADNPDEAFAAVVALRRLAAALEHEAVRSALDQGWTWARIGQSLGMTAQGAHKRLALHPALRPARPNSRERTDR